MAAALFVLWGFKRHQKAQKVVKHDRAAPRMASVRDVTPFTEKQARAKAARFGVESPGVMIGKMVRGGHTLYASWEDTLLHIWGTRTGKTTSQAAPSIIEAPGPVIATSNNPMVAPPLLRSGRLSEVRTLDVPLQEDRQADDGRSENEVHDPTTVPVPLDDAAHCPLLLGIAL